MQTEPSLRLAGAPNFRELGNGAPMRDGRRLRRHRVFRSGELSRLTDADLDALRALGVAFVADLRSRKESELHPSRWPHDLASERYCADLHPDVKLNGRSALDLIIANPDPVNVRQVTRSGFGSMADMCGPPLRQIAERLARGTTPVVYHCTNGRDRTGIVSALLLHMLGAGRDAIVADFMLTNERIDVELVIENSLATFSKALGVVVEREVMELCTLVHAEQIDELFLQLERRFGSPEGFLASLGIDAAMQSAIREHLLEPA